MNERNCMHAYPSKWSLLNKSHLESSKCKSCGKKNTQRASTDHHIKHWFFKGGSLCCIQPWALMPLYYLWCWPCHYCKKEKRGGEIEAPIFHNSRVMTHFFFSLMICIWGFVHMQHSRFLEHKHLSKCFRNREGVICSRLTRLHGSHPKPLLVHALEGLIWRWSSSTTCLVFAGYALHNSLYQQQTRIWTPL